MGLSNGSKKSNNYSSLIVRDYLGGGEKKAGFPYIIGRSYHFNIDTRGRNLDQLAYLQTTLAPPLKCAPRPTWSDARIHMNCGAPIDPMPNRNSNTFYNMFPAYKYH